MLSHSQTEQLFELHKDTSSFFSRLPADITDLIGGLGYDPNPNSKIAIALRHAASGTREDIDIVIAMVKKTPSLLLQAGDVVTRGGIPVKRKKLYEFFLGEGDPDSAKQIEFGFAKIPNGENEQIRQYERYKPYIEALAKQIEAKQPTFDLRPLIEIIKNSPAADIAEALDINNPNREMTRNTPLRVELAKFRRAVSPKNKTDGMHYEHYTTLMQALELLDDEWQVLTNNNTDYAKCRLVWRQIIGYLQRRLPAVDRFGFARAFDDAERTPDYKYAPGSFIDTSPDELELSGLGFIEAIFGWGAPGAWCATCSRGVAWKTHLEQKLRRTYAAAPTLSLNPQPYEYRL